MRVVIAGDDEVALRLAEALMVNHAVTMIHDDDADAVRLARLDVSLAAGRMTSGPVLRAAGVETADLFVGASSVDETNLFSCIAAGRMGAKRTVCFQFRPDAQAPPEELEDLAESLGIDELLAPARLLATEILRIVSVSGALDVEVFEGGRVHLLRYEVAEGAPIGKGTLADLGVPDGVVLVMARRADEVFLPTGITQFQTGDKLTAMGTVEGLNRLLARYLRAPREGREARRATVVGGGVVGLQVARGLEADGWRVKLIEADKARCEEIAPLIDGLVLHGDGADLELLEEEHVSESSVVIAVTSNDERNLLVSLLAKSLGVNRIVTRATYIANERLFERVGIDVVRSARGAAIRQVIAHVDHDKAAMLAELEHGDAEVIELTLPDELKPVQIMDLKSELFAIVGAILRAGRVIIPRGKDVLQGKDRVLVFCLADAEESVRTFFLKELLTRGQDA